MVALIQKVPTTERFRCHSQPCIHDGIHEVSLGGVKYPEHFCCIHMDDLMWELGLDQPDGVEGFAKFRREHEKSCGYVGIAR